MVTTCLQWAQLGAVMLLKTHYHGKQSIQNKGVLQLGTSWHMHACATLNPYWYKFMHNLKWCINIKWYQMPNAVCIMLLNPESPAVICRSFGCWSWQYVHQSYASEQLFMGPIEALHHELMCTCNEVQTIWLVKLPKLPKPRAMGIDGLGHCSNLKISRLWCCMICNMQFQPL